MGCRAPHMHRQTHRHTRGCTHTHMHTHKKRERETKGGGGGRERRAHAHALAAEEQPHDAGVALVGDGRVQGRAPIKRPVVMMVLGVRGERARARARESKSTSLKASTNPSVTLSSPSGACIINQRAKHACPPHTVPVGRPPCPGRASRCPWRPRGKPRATVCPLHVSSCV